MVIKGKYKSNADGATETPAKATGGFWTGLFGAAGQVGSSLLTKPDTSNVTNNYGADTSKSNTGLYIGIAAAAVVAIIVTIVLVNKKK